MQGSSFTGTDNLTAGDHTLEVLITDKLEKRANRRSARQEIDFTVE